MRKITNKSFIISSLLLFSIPSEAQTTLKDAYLDAFKIGVAVNDEITSGKDKISQKIVLKQFNSITLENSMKAALINPQPNIFNFEPADAFIDFGQKNNMFIIGHTLVWHNQTPSWFFQDETGKPKTKEQVAQRLHDHIKAIAGRYAGKVNAWDVVNEVIDDDGNYRQTTWVNGIGSGDELVKMAFNYAAQYAPATELYYNDFNAWRPAKRDGIVRMVKMLQAEGIKIDGIGIQGHWGLNYPKNEYIEQAIDAYAALGLKVMITELDVDVLPLTKEGQIIGQSMGEKQFQNEEFKTFLDPYQKSLPTEIQNELANRYAELFDLFYRKKEKIDRVTFWGVYDAMSWKNGYPIPHRTNYPLLWNRNIQEKPAFEAVLGIPTKNKPWKGKKTAVVLTYDDALNVHLDNVIPALDSLNLKGTFYLTSSSEASRNRINDWRRAAQNGHELGNHTVYHPCDASGPGMSWVKPEYDLSKYTMSQIQSEIKMCNAFLKAIDGKNKRTFAFTCGHKKVAEGEFIQSLSDEFVAARAVRHEMHSFEDQKLMDIDCYSMENKTGEEMIALVKEAQAEGKLLVFLFHGVGGEHALNVSKEAHSQLLHYLKENETDIYIDTMLNVAENLKTFNDSGK